MFVDEQFSHLLFQQQVALRVAYQAVHSWTTHEVFFARDTFEIVSIQATKG